MTDGGLAVHQASRVLSRERRGSSLPVVVETDVGRRFVKLHGASQGVLPLVAEIIVAELAEVVGLSVPARSLVELPALVASDDRNDELRDLLDASSGLNLGFTLLEDVHDPTPAEVKAIDLESAATVLWLDVLVQNYDRAARNPNVMVANAQSRAPAGALAPSLWCIDHGACLPWQHSWRTVTEDTPTRRYDVAGHLFEWTAAVLPEIHATRAPRVTRELLYHATALVPSRWLGEDPPRRREAYVAILWKRLRLLPRLFEEG